MVYNRCTGIYKFGNNTYLRRIRRRSNLGHIFRGKKCGLWAEKYGNSFLNCFPSFLRNIAGRTAMCFNTRLGNSFLNTCDVCNWNEKLIFHFLYAFYLHLLLSTRVLPPGYVTGYLQCVFFYPFTLHMLFPRCTCCLILFCCV